MKAQGAPGAGRTLAISVLLHGALVALIAGGMYLLPRREPPLQRLAIEASVVTADGVLASQRPQPSVPEPEPQIEPEPEPEPVAEPEPLPEPEPPAPPEPQVDEEELRREAEAARVAEERRIAAEREAAQRREVEAREKAEREKAERERLAREKAARETAEREKAERERVERERQAQERARAQREAELNAQIQAEERAAAARASGQMNQYIAQIAARIERAWIRPPSARVGLECEVRVTQVPGGAVTGVQVGRCNGDEAVRQSIEAAVYRASPLPLPPDPALFERNLVITFRPED